MIQACLNGDWDRADAPGVPVTAAELAADAISVVAAGARELHVHPRGPDEVESLKSEDVGACIQAIRQAVPGIPVGIGTGDWIAPGGRARQALMQCWQVCPDYASVNLREDDALEVMTLLEGKGVKVEAGLWSEADLARFIAEARLDNCVRILIEMPDTDPTVALSTAKVMLDRIDQAGITLPVLLHGEGKSAWPCLLYALENGLDTRIGLEDVLKLPDDQTAPGNTALMKAACSMPGFSHEVE